MATRNLGRHVLRLSARSEPTPKSGTIAVDFDSGKPPKKRQRSRRSNGLLRGLDFESTVEIIRERSIDSEPMCSSGRTASACGQLAEDVGKIDI